MSKPGPLYYGDYLGLKELLSCQRPKSEELKRPAHEEMLFIIVHQVYELWFKQILHELDSVIAMFNSESMDEKNMGVAVSRLHRVTEIQKLLVDQLHVLETMTPLDFLEFRDLLVPASGFQSVQFRLIENRLGLKSADRLRFSDKPYQSYVHEDDRSTLDSSEKTPSLLECVTAWLERTPFLTLKNFNFLSSYKKAVDVMLKKDEEIIRNNAALGDQGRERQLQLLAAAREKFSALFDEAKHSELVKNGERRLSYKATLATLFIFLYRDQPILQLPFQFLNKLMDIDEFLTTWRYRHVQMVQRMIGMKIGTGGSSGADYLRQAAESHKLFSDFAQMSTFLIPRSSLPALPVDVEKNLGFHFSTL